MTVKQMYNLCAELMEKGCEGYDLQTIYKNCDGSVRIDREDKIVELR